jgi:proteic killer suppression protein
MINSFKDREAEKIFNGEVSRKLPSTIQSRAFNKLTALHSAAHLKDLKIPPSNHLEELKGRRKDQYSIRINGQFRVCFRWIDNKAEDVEIVDYH